MNQANGVDHGAMVNRIHQLMHQQDLYQKPPCPFQIMAQLLGFLGFEDIVVYQVKGQRLTQVAAHGPKRCARHGVVDPITLEMGEGVVGHSAKQQTMTWLHEAVYDKRCVIDDQNRQSELAMPFYAADRLLGVLDSEHQQPYHFNQSHINLMHAVIEVVGFATKPQHEAPKNPSQATAIPNNIHNLQSPVTSANELPGSPTDWSDWVLAGMKHYTDSQQLSQLLKQRPHLQKALPSVAAFRRLLLNTSQSYAQVEKTTKYHKILFHTYVQPLCNGQLVAERLHMAYSTYRRHLKKAQDMLVCDVQEQLQQFQQKPKAKSSVPMSWLREKRAQ